MNKSNMNNDFKIFVIINFCDFKVNDFIQVIQVLLNLLNVNLIFVDFVIKLMIEIYCLVIYMYDI